MKRGVEQRRMRGKAREHRSGKCAYKIRKKEKRESARKGEEREGERECS